jgi:hypothetical protein
LSTRCILLGVSSDFTDAFAGHLFASIPFDRIILERLNERIRCYSRAKEGYPDLYETYEFQSLPQWYETDKSQSYDDQSDRDKLQRLSYDAELGDGEPCDESVCIGLDRLDAQEINWLAVPEEELPSTGNLRTECDQLVMSPYGDESDIVDLRWICYLKHTDIALRTTEINSKNIDDWLTELERGDQHAEEATQSRP